MIKSFKDLKVWQKGMDLCEAIYQATSKFPSEEKFGLTNQIRKASISVVSNIAEGHERNSTKEYINFLYIASGSLAELETQIILAEKLGYLNDTTNLISSINEIGKMVRAIQLNLTEKVNIAAVKNLKTLTPRT